MNEQLALLPEYLTAHLELALAALAVGTLVSVPLGIWLTRNPRLEQPVLGIASAIQTIPSLALLAVMVPTLAAIGLQSIGYLPAFIGLTLYSLLPILSNTVTGIAGVEPALVEAARGVGMTSRQQLLRVELPLAMPVIVAGLRTSTVWVVGIATLSTPVGAPSLGNYIFSGLQTRNYNAVLVGCIAAATLALVLDGLVRTLEIGIRKRRRARVVVATVVLASLASYTAVTSARDLFAKEDTPVVVGAKTFTEQYVLSQVLAGHIRRRTGAPTEIVQSLGSTVLFDSLRSGDVDVCVDYAGTIWATVMGRSTLPSNRDVVLREVTAWLARRHGIEVVAKLGFENAYALAMTRERATALGVRTISDLAAHSSRLTAGSDYEFFTRREWRSLLDTYRLKFARQRSMDPSLMYQALVHGEVDVVSVYSTDGRIEALDLVVLEDDRHAIPPYDAIVLVSRELVENRPEVRRALRGLENAIDMRTMRRLNQGVDEHRKSPAAVAEAFLAHQRGR